MSRLIGSVGNPKGAALHRTIADELYRFARTDWPCRRTMREPPRVEQDGFHRLRCGLEGQQAEKESLQSILGQSLTIPVFGQTRLNQARRLSVNGGFRAEWLARLCMSDPLRAVPHTRWGNKEFRSGATTCRMSSCDSYNDLSLAMRKPPHPFHRLTRVQFVAAHESGSGTKRTC
jgi:hypothetical protein